MLQFIINGKGKNQKGGFSMAERKTDEQKLQELQKKMEQLKEQEKAIKARANEKERKARNHRLIQNGALAEKYLQAENILPADFENILNRLVKIEQVKSIIGGGSNGNT